MFKSDVQFTILLTIFVPLDNYNIFIMYCVLGVVLISAHVVSFTLTVLGVSYIRDSDKLTLIFRVTGIAGSLMSHFFFFILICKVGIATAHS